MINEVDLNDLPAAATSPANNNNDDADTLN